MPTHTLTLRDLRKAQSKKIYEYGRHVDVLWSPASDAVIVNDYEGSDASHPVLFTLPLSGEPNDLREKITAFLRMKGKAKSVEENHHVYFVAERWLGRSAILCKVWGYGEVDPGGFTRRYVYRLDGLVRASPKQAIPKKKTN